jgi:hypothetical protein
MLQSLLHRSYAALVFSRGVNPRSENASLPQHVNERPPVVWPAVLLVRR